MGLILGPAQWLRIQPLAWELPYATGAFIKGPKYTPKIVLHTDYCLGGKSLHIFLMARVLCNKI